MCGIAGIYNINGEPVDGRLIGRMTDSIAHRGPDDQGIYLHENIGLGHRRLSIIDLSPAGHQPLCNDDGTLWITYNGEVYNAESIRKELPKSIRYRGKSDTEVLLYAYKHWGKECLSRFNGMFAFAIWDKVARSLFVARDRFGVKPFFYYFDGLRFAFASEIKALLQLPFVPREPDTATAYSYLAHRVMDGPENTYFKNIHQLGPSHAMLVTSDGLSKWQWYAIEAREEKRRPSLEEAVDHVRTLFDDSIRLRFVSDVPVATNLSGGFDSTCIATYAVDYLKRSKGVLPHKTFTACFHDAKEDERPFVELVARELPLDMHYEFIDSRFSLAQIEAQTLRQDQPVMSPAMIAKGEVMRSVHEAGIKVTLEGQGIDEYCCGYTDASRFAIADQLRSGEFLGAMRQIAGWRKIGGISFWDGFRSASDLAFPKAMSLASRVKRLFRENSLPYGDNRYLAEPFRSSNGVPPLKPYAKGILDDYCIRQMFGRNLPFFLRCDDHNAMAFSVESREPFLDYRLVEYVLSLPNDFRIRDGWSKWIFRESMRGIIPEAIRSYPGKRPFPTPTEGIISSPTREEIETRISSKSFASSGFFNPSEVKSMYHELCAGNRKVGFKMWPILNYDTWLRCFIH
jgi:asparagine synthase (glutamine-hydrolysing)